MRVHYRYVELFCDPGFGVLEEFSVVSRVTNLNVRDEYLYNNMIIDNIIIKQDGIYIIAYTKYRFIFQRPPR